MNFEALLPHFIIMDKLIKKALEGAEEFKHQIKNQEFSKAVITALDLAIISKDLREGKR